MGKKCVRKGKAFGTLLTDLSKTFDCLDHILFLTKLNAYSFNLPALPLIHEYLSNRKKRTKIEITYRTWTEILFRITHGPIFRPISLSISF